MSYRNTRKRKENGRTINTLNLKAHCKNKDFTGIGFLAGETSASSLSAVSRCLLTCLTKGRAGNSAVVLRTLLWFSELKEYAPLKHWKALSESGLLHIFLRARSVLNCRTGFREELHLLCQSSPSWCSCVEEAMLCVTGRVHPAGRQALLSLQTWEEGVKGTVRCDRLDGRGQPELGLLQSFIFQFRAGPSLPGWVHITCVSPKPF